MWWWHGGKTLGCLIEVDWTVAVCDQQIVDTKILEQTNLYVCVCVWVGMDACICVDGVYVFVQ